MSNLSGVARPSRAMRRMMGRLHGSEAAVLPGTKLPIDKILDDIEAITSLAKLIDAAMTASTSPKGNLNIDNMAIYMLREMQKARK